MQVWIYFREPEVGDYVYADGSWSDKLNKNRTVIGICFYIDEEDKTRRLCVSATEIKNQVWGLSKSNWSDGITLLDSPEYNVFKIPGLKDYGFGGAGNGSSAMTINEANYLEDGEFKIFSPSSAAGELGWRELTEDLQGHKAGEYLPIGLMNTLNLIRHRDKICKDSGIKLPLPNPSYPIPLMTQLDNLISNVISENGGETKYQQFYYPAVSSAIYFEPEIKEGEDINDQFKAGQWWLPAPGELARICWYFSKGYDSTVEDAIFTKLITAGFSKYTATKFASSNYMAWNSGYHVWYCSFSSLQLNGYGNYCHNPHNVLPVCAF